MLEPCQVSSSALELHPRVPSLPVRPTVGSGSVLTHSGGLHSLGTTFWGFTLYGQVNTIPDPKSVAREKRYRGPFTQTLLWESK